MRGYNSRVDKGAIAVSKTIGILGGMGALATVDLFHKIVDMTYSDSDSGHLHIIVDNNTELIFLSWGATRHIIITAIFAILSKCLFLI